MIAQLKLILFILCFFSSGIVASQNYDIKQISSLDGLSQNSVTALEVDEVGNIWIGTTFGLNRYDGRQVYKYFFDNSDENSIPNNHIQDLHKDDQGNLWVLTQWGGACYNPKSDDFNRSPFNRQISGRNNITEDSDNVILISSGNKLIQYNKEDKSVQVNDISPNIGQSPFLKVASLDEDRLIALSYTEGIVEIIKDTGKLLPFFDLKGEPFVDFVITEKGIYVSTINSLYHLNRSGKIINHKPKLFQNYNNPIVLGINYNKTDNTLWVITDGDGVLIFDELLNEESRLKSGVNVSGVLPENSLQELIFKDNNIVLLGSVRAGLIILSPTSFKHYKYLNGAIYGPSAAAVSCILEDDDKNIWIGTDGGGLNLLNEETDTFKYFEHPDVVKIISIVSYSDRFLLISSYRKGLYFFDKKNKEFVNVEEHPLLGKVKSDRTQRLYKDALGNIWISTGLEIFKINKKRDALHSINKEQNKADKFQVPNYFYHVLETANGNMWFSYIGGMSCYSVKDNKVIKEIRNNNIKIPIGNVIYTMIEDKNGNILFGTNRGGLFEYNILNDKVSEFTLLKKESPKIVFSLFYNNKNQIWAGTNEGLIRIDRDSSNASVSYYNSLGEIGGNEYHRTVLKSLDGRLYMGNNNGMVVFDPEEVVNDKTEPVVTITNVSRKILSEEKIINDQLSYNIQDSCRVVVDYKATAYNFEFNTFNILNGEHTQFSYTLENFENIWHTSKSNFASYSELKEGNYVFKVKATNQNGIMGSRITKVNLTIRPPWWRTIWVRGFGILFLLGSIIMVWRESLNKTKILNQLKLERFKRDKLKEINQLKLSFFTNISHELKTPLTLILAPLEQMVKSNKKPEEIRRYFPFLYRNAKRMSELITQLLEFRKAEMSSLELKMEQGDLVSDCRNALDYFEHQAEFDGVQMNFKSNFQSYPFNYDRDKLFKILFNLLSNALKHTKSGDKIEVELLEAEENGVIIKVIDTGTGIQKEELLNIFDRFYQSDHKEIGSGIGLAFAKKLVELQNGKIRVESEFGEGATFIIELPNNVLGENITESVDEIKVLREEYKKEPIKKREDNKSTLNKDAPLILIVEDDWGIRQYVTGLFEDHYNVIQANNGRDGFDRAVLELPDLILSDLMMPIMDGLELCEKIKEDLRTSHIPIVLLTAKSDVKNRLEGYRLGADAYIPKPFDNEILLTQVSGILKNRKILKNRFSHDLDLKLNELSQTSRDEKFLDKAISVVEMNLDNSLFNVNTFVKEVGLGRTLVYEKIKALTGKTINDFIQHIRMRKAAELLKSTNDSIVNISICCGFSDPTYFSTVFKKYYKISPSEYRSKN
ncbi:ATP-binding protein [Tamlana sp. 2201CG12-4]|uniref:hybrid sensor histidine kinase/response regulator transcription factor n=1 Tax=Tamlana sp. 2201CG12-4 TaxID=3112582 RepID=UPI002DB9FA53|nr:ATP-binding protein [Tamlana sp. 2201CG12-4]MEC3907207.1 ATP-binding protein [Tamlana sp. 2201CG12-4]